MGISTIQSYRGAQIFEAIGLRQAVIDKYFTWTPSRIGGIGLDVIAQRSARCATAPPSRTAPVNGHALPVGGQYQWRADGEYHLFNPEIDPQAAEGGAHRQLHDLQGIRRSWSTTSRSSLCTLRGLLDFKPADAGSARGSRVGREHHEALQDRRDVLRLDQQGSARDAGHRHEPHRRQEQHRRRRRRPGALPCRCRTATRRTARSSRSPPAASA